MMLPRSSGRSQGLGFFQLQFRRRDVCVIPHAVEWPNKFTGDAKASRCPVAALSDFDNVKQPVS
jgi:hypothetical protein